jgi:hypothetical protein
MSIELDRQFVECSDDEKSDPDLVARFSDSSHALEWADLLARRRVVLLAEAGSGKTTEMTTRARQQTEAGEYSFYATVEDVGRKGLMASMRATDRASLTRWLSSDKDAWLFIDSVDEAKQSGVRLPVALQAIAEAISGAERRAHIVLSGRYTDWQFRRDLAQLQGDLAIPADETLLPPPTPDELVINVIHHERPVPPPAPEKPIVVVMRGLDEARVRRFAAGKQIENLDTFIAQLEAAGLWQFARRPLDLDWLVQFWHSHKRLGALAEMLEICIAERLQESNFDRARQDNLDVARAYHAVERIGAAMIFGRRDTIAVPDSEIDLTDTPSLIDLADVLPDWSPQDRERLLTRAVFDPATLGRARIHNDNQGVVSSYLAARWLHRLRQANLSQQGLFDLLFGDEHQVPVIKPSMQTTAAWLSLWDDAVAREVERRDPFLLLDTGDPASLPLGIRERLLARVAERIAAGDQIPSLDGDNLKKFSRPDLASSIRKLWEKYAENKDIHRLLLRIIWLGEIKQCADIPVGIALDPTTDQREAAFAGRALMATAEAGVRDQYARFVTRNASTLPSTILWNAADELFPRHISVDDVIGIISKANATAADGGLELGWRGPELIARISSKADLGKILTDLLKQLGGIVAAGDRDTTAREKAYFPIIAAAADRLLELSSLKEAPLPAIDAAVRLGESIRVSRIARERVPDVTDRLQASITRRRAAFWQFVKRLAGHRILDGRPIDSLWDLQMLGWAVTLSVEDVDWLLADAPAREAANERALAINTAMAILRDMGRREHSEQRIRAVTGADPAMNEALNAWLNPRENRPKITASERRLQKLQHRNAIERASSDQSWITFAADLRIDPVKMRNLRPTGPEGCDAKLFHLWSLLNNAVDAGRHYSISTVSPLEPMIGVEATEGFRLGLIAHWRAWTPWLRSGRKSDEQNQTRSLDSMGLAGITLEKVGNPNWAAGLEEDDARRAVGYATLELNGFPTWLTDLAIAKPAIVADVLLREGRTELDLPPDVPRFGAIQDLARGDRVLAELVAPAILTELENRPNLPVGVLSNVLDIVVRGPPSERNRLKTLLLKRFETETTPAASSLYVAALFSIDGASATDAVFEKLKKLKRKDQPVFAQRVLPNIFGRRFSEDAPLIQNLPLPSLERLVRLAFEAVRIEDDTVHPSETAYFPDERDDAESARGAAFSRLLNIPGRAGFDAIMRLAKVPGFPISPARLREFAKQRAAKDSELTPWKPREVVAFEKTAEMEPHTPRELQLLSLRRLSDMQYDLVNDDFQQGETLAGLQNEKAVQKFIADRLRLKQGRSYSVEREVHVADEKEPDVRLRAKVTDASVPLEIKVAESWTFEELEAALKTQLCDKYLRARDTRHGILLLVHQEPRTRGWSTLSGKKLTFVEVVAHLKRMAVKISGSAVDAPQPAIATLDVTHFVQPAAKLRKGRNAKSATRKAAKSKNLKVKASKNLKRRAVSRSAKSRRSTRP